MWSILVSKIYLESFEKFLWVVVVGGGWCLNVDLVIGFGPSLDLGTWTYGQADQYFYLSSYLAC